MVCPKSKCLAKFRHISQVSQSRFLTISFRLRASIFLKNYLEVVIFLTKLSRTISRVFIGGEIDTKSGKTAVRQAEYIQAFAKFVREMQVQFLIDVFLDVAVVVA